MTRFVVEIIHHIGPATPQRFVFDQKIVHIGRGFHNDIIITDPHVSAHHITLERKDDNTLALHDRDSLNGVFIRDVERIDQTYILKSGDDFTIGRTTLRVFDHSHPIDPAVPMLPGAKILQKIGEPGWGGFIFMMVLALITAYGWFDVWSPEQNVTLMALTLGSGGVMLVWAAGWAIAGRLIRHKAKFTAHLSVVALYTALSMVAYYITSYIQFLSSDTLISKLLSYTLTTFLLYYLLKFHLRLSTHITPPRRRLIAGAFAIGLVAGTLGITHLAEKKFSNAPKFSNHLKPYLVSWAPSKTIDAYLLSTQNLFVSANKNAEKK